MGFLSDYLQLIVGIFSGIASGVAGAYFFLKNSFKRIGDLETEQAEIVEMQEKHAAQIRALEDDSLRFKESLRRLQAIERTTNDTKIEVAKIVGMLRAGIGNKP